MANEKCIRVYADPIQIEACRKMVKENNDTFSRLANIFALTGNEVRLKILYLLEEENELCPCDLADILDMTVPAVSQHLRKLKDGRIVKTRRSGQTIYYSLESENLKPIRPFFKQIAQSIKEKIV